MTITTDSKNTLDLYDSTVRLNDYQLLERVQRHHSPLKSMRGCSMFVPQPNHNNVYVESSNIKGTSFKGLNRCRSRLCPVCNKIDVAIQQGLIMMKHYEFKKRGYVGFFITLTQPRESDLEVANSQIGRHLTMWKKRITRYYSKKNGYSVPLDVKNLIASKDITFNLSNLRQAYHLHYHNLLYVPREFFGMSEDEMKLINGQNKPYLGFELSKGVKSKIESFKAQIKRIWVETTGHKSIEKAQDIQLANDDEITTYIKKVESASSLTWELISKRKQHTHKKETITWIELLGKVATEKCSKAISVYRKTIEVMRGKKWLSIGKGVKDLEVSEEIEELITDKLTKENEEISKNEKTKSFRLSTALFKMIQKFRLRGVLCSMLDRSWNEDLRHQINQFKILTTKSIEITELYTTTPREMIMLKPYFLCWVQSLFEKDLINDETYDSVRRQLY